MDPRYEPLVLSPKKEKKRIQAAKQEADQKFAPGDYYCLVATKWYQTWESYVNDGDSKALRPPEIDNSGLVLGVKDAWTEPNTVLLQPNLQENIDYVLVSAAEYSLLKKWYNGGPRIERKVVKEKSKRGGRVEVYLLHLKVVLANKSGEPSSKSKDFYVSRDTQIDTFTNILLREYKFTASVSIRIWSFQDASTFALLEVPSHTLADEQLIPGETILLEVKKDGRWPRDGKPKKNFIGSALDFFTGKQSPQELLPVSTYPKGVCGLDNLGNTCFMNSSLQCLTNTALFSEHFLSGKYKPEINRNNPLGHKGNVAEAYAALCKALWAGQSASVAPRNLKSIISKYAPQFEGYQQHDSQEFTGFLLDGLHEDLNKVTKKPFVETPNAEGRLDEDVSTEAWKGHLSRNESIVVDLFHGQLKSKVQCPDCDKISITFDPFMFLPLPLQEQTKRTIEASLVILKDNHKNPVLHALEVPANGSIKDLRRAIAMLADLSEEQSDNIKIADIVSSKIYKFYGDKHSIDQIGSRDTTFIYEIPRTGRYMLMLQRRRKMEYSYSRHEIIGLPMVLSFGSYDINGKQLYQLVWNMVQRLCQGDGDAAYSVDENRSDDDGPDEKKKKPKKRAYPGDQLDFKADLPFRICLTNPSGTGCSLCDDVCIGCTIKPSQKELPFLHDPDRHMLTIHWRKWAQRKFYDLNEAKSVTVHPSVHLSRKKKNDESTVDLFDCLRMFSSREQLGPNDMW